MLAQTRVTLNEKFAKWFAYFKINKLLSISAKGLWHDFI